MRRPMTKAVLSVSAAGVMVVAAFAGTAIGPVAAAVRAHRDTLMCQQVTNCVTPRLYGDSTSVLGQALEVSPQISKLSNAPVVVAPYDSTELLQDWLYIDYGSVASYQSLGAFGLTAFDFSNYHSGELYALEFAPAGIPTGYCAANVSDKMVLRACNGSVFQTYIGIPDVVGGLVAPSGIYYFFEYALSVARVSAIAHHYAATGSRLPDVQVYFTTPRFDVNQWWGEGVMTPN